MSQMSLLLRLKNKWGLASILQVVAVLVVFSLAGSSVVFLRKSLFSLLGFNSNTSLITKTVTYIIFVFPAYQLLLLIYGFLLGQFRFFWEKEKKILRWISSKLNVYK